MVEIIEWQNVGRNEQRVYAGVAGRQIYRWQVPHGYIFEIYTLQAINKTRETGYCVLFVRDGPSATWHVHLKGGSMENYAGGDCFLIWNGRVRARYDVNAEISNVSTDDDIQIRMNYRLGIVKDT